MAQRQSVLPPYMTLEIRNIKLRLSASLTRKDIGAECRHNVRPSVQLPSVSGVDSKLGPRCNNC